MQLFLSGRDPSGSPFFSNCWERVHIEHEKGNFVVDISLDLGGLTGKGDKVGDIAPDPRGRNWARVHGLRIDAISLPPKVVEELCAKIMAYRT